MEFREIETMKARFLECFLPEWEQFLRSCDPTLSAARQLHIGNHMRPQLACWGFMINKDITTHNDYAGIAKLAVSIEAIHKASVIIDDIIDGDTKRRGEDCMHVAFGVYHTVLFAVCMLARGIEQFRNALPDGNSAAYADMVDTLCGLIHSMCSGAITELSASVQQQIDLSFVQSIIDCETAQLIKNSLYMGFLLSGEANAAAGDRLCAIGLKCGYIFQVMNDLEPFCNPRYIAAYKGDINADYIRSRKSIVLPYLYRACSKKDKERLLNAIGSPESFEEVRDLFDKYSVRTEIVAEAETIFISILHILNDMEQTEYSKWAGAFRVFIRSVQEKYQAILYPQGMKP